MEVSVQKRSANFSAKEKQVLFSIIHNYKHIVENKKTDAVSTHEKNLAWNSICEEFNASCPDTRFRSVASIKKMYSNSKQNLRKNIAEERQETFSTGGGVAVNLSIDDDLLLPLLNKKTVYGLGNPVDSEIASIVNMDQGPNDVVAALSSTRSEDDPFASETTECQEANDINMVTPSSKIWTRPGPSKLKTPISESLRRKNLLSSGKRDRLVRPFSSSDVGQKYQGFYKLQMQKKKVDY